MMDAYSSTVEADNVKAKDINKATARCSVWVKY